MDRTRPPSTTRGFTLLELLVTIGIILVLIAIALPYFLDAMIRANVTRTHAELKAISQSLERYHLDFRFYPLRATPAGQTWPSGLHNLTTPIAYMDPAWLEDRFPEPPFYTHYRYWPIRPDGFVQNNTNPNNKDSNWYLLSSNGPDNDFNAFADSMRGGNPPFIDTIYSPTNGTKSGGNIWRLGGAPDGVAKVYIIPVFPGFWRN